MKSRPDDPRHLDVEGCAKGAVTLQGEVALQALPRLADMAYAGNPLSDGAVPTAVVWRAQGESRAARGGSAQIWLHLDASTTLALTCQRCLNAVMVPLHARRSFRFVAGEDAAAQLDAEIGEDEAVDVLALPRVLDVHELVEDELLLALPLVPRHDVCPQPLRAPADAAPLEERANPFAALDVLKGGGSRN